MDDSADDDDQTRVASGEAEGRESGIVEVERKASALTGGVTSAAMSLASSTTKDEVTGTRESVPSSGSGSAAREIEIDTDLGEGSAPRAQMITQTNETGGRVSASSDGADGVSGDDDAIPVSDDEIESAEPMRPTLTSGLPAFTTRTRPPAPPSLRPRASSTSLPPPRRLLGSSLPPPSFPSQFPSDRLPSFERDPWMLANKTLELSRATARISVLEDQIAFRDARILTLEERLETAQQKLAELEAQLDHSPAGAPSTAARATAARATAARATSTPSRTAALSPAATQPSVAKGAVTNGAVHHGAVHHGAVQGGGVARPTNKPAVAIPKPGDMSKPPSSRQPLTPAAAAVFATDNFSKKDALAKEAASKEAVSKSAATTSSVSKSSPAQAPVAAGVASAAANARQADVATQAVAERMALTPEPPQTGSVAPPSLVAELAASRAPNGPEDLQRIAGIGPRFEALLRKQGITKVSQIAAWTDADLRQAAKSLKIPKSRIVKGRWVETARELTK